MFNVCLV